MKKPIAETDAAWEANKTSLTEAGLSKKEKDKEYEDHLIRNIVCPKCRINFLSNYEYNRHIVDCTRVYGDM